MGVNTINKLDIAKALLLQMKEPERICVRYDRNTREKKIVSEQEYHESIASGEKEVYMSQEWKDNYTPTRYHEELKEVRRLLADIERDWGFNK